VSGTYWGTTLAATFRASPGKTGLLGFLAVVLLVVVGRQVLHGPHPAGAAVVPGDPVDTALIPGSTTGPAPERRPRLPLPDLPARPARDPFDTDWSLFATTPSVKTADQSTEDEDTVEGTPVPTLKLTLTASADGGEPYAVIDDTLVRIGDAIGEFVVESIDPGQVILSVNGRERIALRMN